MQSVTVQSTIAFRGETIIIRDVMGDSVKVSYHHEDNKFTVFTMGRHGESDAIVVLQPHEARQLALFLLENAQVR